MGLQSQTSSRSLIDLMQDHYTMSAICLLLEKCCHGLPNEMAKLLRRP